MNIMFTYDALVKAKNDPIALIKSAPQHNAKISQMAILLAALNSISQPVLQTLESVPLLNYTPSLLNASSTFMFYTAVFSNEHVVSFASSAATLASTHLPDNVKEMFFDNNQEAEKEAISHKMN